MDTEGSNPSGPLAPTSDPPDPTMYQRQAPFTLNQNVQVDKLVADAAISDCEFVANNSDQNVSIQCSSGFYKAVAKPAFSSLSPGFSHRSGDALVTCSNIEHSCDYRGVEYNRIFWFSIRDQAGTCASVTVHLHHTTRLVQVQGGAIISDGLVAAVWFVKNLLLGLFLQLGQARGLDISAFNQAVIAGNFNSSCKDITPDDTCTHCSKPLRKPAKPIKCFACKSIFHTTCHKQHSCQGTPARPRTVTRMKRKASEISSFNDSIFEITDNSAPPPPTSTQQPPTSTQNAQPQGLLTVSSSANMSQIPQISLNYPSIAVPTTSPPVIGTNPFNPTTTFSAPQSISSIIQPPRLSAFTQFSSPPTSSTGVSESSSSPPTSISIPSVFLRSSSTPSLQVVPVRPPAKKQRKAPSVTKEGAEKEYLKIQLNLAQTKIASQDNSLKKQEETISLLSERLRLLELGINTQYMSQYFPSSNPSPQTSATHARPTPSVPAPSTSAPTTPPNPSPQISATALPTSTNARPTPSVPAPSTSAPTAPPSAPPVASFGSSPCSACTNLSRHMEIALTELGLIKRQTDVMQADIASIKTTGHHLASSQTHPSHQDQNRPQFSAQNSSAPQDSSEQSGQSSNRRQKISRHAQTQAAFADPPVKPPTRPIRPLFPSTNPPVPPPAPCPWQTGFFPQGPVRQLPSHNQPPVTSRPRSRVNKSVRSQPDRPHQARQNKSFQPRSSLITEVPMGPSTPPPAPAASQPDVPAAPADRDTLNF